MNKVALISTVVGALAFSSLAGVALADPGGVPNDNAQAINDNANGRKGNCPVLGFSISDIAQVPGLSVPEVLFGEKPGQLNSENCTPKLPD